MKKGVMSIAVALACAGSAFAAVVGEYSWGDAVYQWSVPLEGYELKGVTPKAYLWVPETCTELKAVVLGNDNMLEERIFDNPHFRQALASADTGIVWVVPAIGEITTYDEATQTRIAAFLSALAEKSGYRELETVPIAALGHSAWADWPYIMTAADPSRMLCAISVKGSWPEGNRTYPTSLMDKFGTTPILLVNGEYEDGVRREKLAKQYFDKHPEIPFAMYVDYGCGHFDADESLCKLLGGYVATAVRGGDTVAYVNARQKSVPTGAVRELTYLQDGSPMAYSSNHVRLRLATATTGDELDFTVEPTFMDTSVPASERAKLVTSVICGPAAERGANRYAFRRDRRPFASGEYGRLVTLQQTYPGSDGVRASVVEAEIKMPSDLTGGMDNNLTFTPPETITGNAGDRIRLSATSSAGAKVYYYVESGPATINDDGVLLLTGVPPKASAMVDISVVAWSWGRAAEPQIKTATPVIKTIRWQR